MAHIISSKKIPIDILKKVEAWKEAYDKACTLGKELDEYFDDKLDTCVFENSYEVLTEEPDEPPKHHVITKYNGAMVLPVAFKVKGEDKWVAMETFF